MSLAQTPAETTAPVGLPGAAVVVKIRRLLIVAVIAAVAYSFLMVAIAGYCPGGSDGNGGYFDASGRPIDEPLPCVQLTLRPSTLVYVAIAVIVLVAITRVTKAPDVPSAVKTLNRAAWGAVVLVVVAVVVSMIWFRMVPIESFATEGGSIFSPFPFGIIDVATEPMTGS